MKFPVRVTFDKLDLAIVLANLTTAALIPNNMIPANSLSSIANVPIGQGSVVDLLTVHRNITA